MTKKQAGQYKESSLHIVVEAITTLPNLAMVKGTNNYLISYNNNSLLSEKVMTGDVIIAKLISAN